MLLSLQDDNIHTCYNLGVPLRSAPGCAVTAPAGRTNKNGILYAKKRLHFLFDFKHPVLKGSLIY